MQFLLIVCVGHKSLVLDFFVNQLILFFLKMTLIAKNTSYFSSFFLDNLTLSLLLNAVNSAIILDFSFSCQLFLLVCISSVTRSFINIFEIKNFLSQRIIFCVFAIFFNSVLGHASSFSNCMKDTDFSGEYTENLSSTDTQNSQNTPQPNSQNTPQPSLRDIFPRNPFNFSNNQSFLHPGVGGDFPEQSAINARAFAASHAQQTETPWSNFQTSFEANVSRALCCDAPEAGQPLFSFSFNFPNFFSSPNIVSLTSANQAPDNSNINQVPGTRTFGSSHNLAIMAQGGCGASSNAIVPAQGDGGGGVSPSSNAIVPAQGDGGGWPSIPSFDSKSGGDSHGITDSSRSRYSYSLAAADSSDVARQADYTSFTKAGGSDFLEVFANPFEPLKEGDNLDPIKSLEAQIAFEKFRITMGEATNSKDDGKILLAIQEYFKSFEECSASDDLLTRLNGSSLIINDFVYNFPLSSEDEKHVTQIIKTAVEKYKKKYSCL